MAEFVLIDEHIRRAGIEGLATAMDQAATQNGSLSIRADAFEKLKAGVIDVTEIERVIGSI